MFAILGGIYVDYKKMMILITKRKLKKLLEEVKDPYTLKRVYKLLEYLYIKEMTGD